MENRSVIKKSSKKWRIVLVVGGVLSNVLLFLITNRLKLPFFLDTIGTISAAAIGGLFPGILTAVASNAICAIVDENSLYFMIVNVLVAIFASWYARYSSFKRIDKAIIFALTAGLFSGVMGASLQTMLFGQAQNSTVNELTVPMEGTFGIPSWVAFYLANILINLLDKTITTAVAFLVIVLMPSSEADEVRDSGWRQKPLTGDELRRIRDWGKDVKLTSRTRMALTLVSMSLILVVIMGWIGISLYFEGEKNARIDNAWNSARFTATMIDTDKIDTYIRKGRTEEDYVNFEYLLATIRNNAYGVDHLYIVRGENDGVRIIFDLPYEGKEIPYEPGGLVPYGASPVLPGKEDLSGGVSGSNEVRGMGNWLMSVYYPVIDASDKCVCYVCADVSLEYMAEYMRRFIMKVAVILSGFFVLIVAYALWTTDVYSTYPISSMAEMLDRFSKGDDSQEQLDENVREIRTLGIQTGDETEKLYRSICSMTLSQAEQMRSIRRLSDSTAKMQDGLIMTVADMVENRDATMGPHIQRTTAFVRIILENLKKKGYYAEKISPKFMSDVIRSAPLYDVGKIKISDEILFKPGKLTKDEFEIMKTHTIEGKKILDDAINMSNGDNYLKEARNMVAYHHERWDGKGYPEGLHGEVIPLSARIMAIADMFDAMTSDKVYRKAKPLDKAVEIMESESGKAIDPKCLEAFMDGLPEIKVIMMKYGNKNV